MLTKDLIRVRAAATSLKPMFIDCADETLISIAHDLLQLYREGEGCTRAELEEAAEACTTVFYDRKLADGLLKLIQDRAEFMPVADCDYPQARAALFRHSAEMIRRKCLPEEIEQVRERIFAETSDDIRPLSDGVFCDLPENERLRSFKKTFDRELLERYNVSLVQSLLLYADSMTLVLSENQEPAAMRRLFRYMKFFRLLFRAEHDLAKKRITLTIDGPGSILEHSVKYGLQLASFFPAVCQLSEWEMSCTVDWNAKKRKLKVDQSTGLRSHYTHISAYQPEEVRMFAELFRKKVSDWTLDDTPDWISAGGQQMFFPDFVFTSNQGQRVPMEVFHRWYFAQIEQRLTWCEANPQTGLLLAVDRSVLKKDNILKDRLESSPYFQTHGLMFRDFPGVENTLELLNQ